MEWFTDAWAWLGHEVVHFGLRWLAAGAALMLGILLFGRNYKRRIAALENHIKASQPTVIVKEGGIYNHTEGDTHIHHHISGEVEIREPKAGRVIPLHVELPKASISGEWRPELEHVKADDPDRQ